MRLARLLRILAAVVVFVPLAKANGPVSMVFTGANGVSDGQYYVSPYYGTMNGQSVVLFCDDIINEVNFNQQWQANVTNLGTAIATNNFSQTRYGGVSGSALFTNTSVPYYDNPGQAYEEAAWLVTQFASNPKDLVNLQYALWDIMNPGARGNTNSDVQNWLTLAGESQNYGSINPYDFEIVTNVAPVCLTGQVQEFLVETPEPGTLALLLCGLLALAVRLYHRNSLAR